MVTWEHIELSTIIYYMYTVLYAVTQFTYFIWLSVIQCADEPFELALLTAYSNCKEKEKKKSKVSLQKVKREGKKVKQSSC